MRSVWLQGSPQKPSTVRIVFDNSEWQCRIALSVGLGQLLQCLCCVEKTATVGNCNVDFFWCDN